MVSNDLSLAASFLSSGSHRSALKLAKRMQRSSPSDPLPWNIAGICLSAMNKLPEAIAQFQRALKVDPGFTDARLNLAQTLILAGRYEQAIKAMQPIGSKDQKASFFLAQAYFRLGDMTPAETAIDHSVLLDDRFAPALNLQGLIRLAQGRECDAIAAFEAALTADPNNVETLVNISLPLARQNRHQDGHRMAERAVQLAPTHIGARLRLGTSFMEKGQFPEAEEQFLEILNLEPSNAQAIAQLSRITPRKRLAHLERSAAKALRKARKSSMDAAEIQFALSRIHDVGGDLAAAAKARQDANGTLAKLLHYDPQADSHETARILAKFPTAPAVAGQTGTSPYPIYVLGLPRSGTSLVEAMLSRAPNVETLGERAATGFLLSEHLASDDCFSSQDAEAFAKNHDALLPDMAPDTVAFVDKMPENYRYIGFLKTAFPQCKIIHVIRDPRDTALSMWKTHFSGRALNYTYDQEAMAHRFALHARMMAHWKSLFPGQILTVSYEDLATDPIGSSQAIASYCGMNWVPEMAAPEGSDAPTLTASASQIRQPVHNRSIGQWRQHKEELAPFLAALDASLWPGLTG